MYNDFNYIKEKIETTHFGRQSHLNKKTKPWKYKTKIEHDVL